MAYDRGFLLDLFGRMVVGRKLEERIQALFQEGRAHGTTHLSIGEEATAVGSIAALRPDDYVFGTHRGHCQALAKGVELNALMAEILAKDTGCCRGLGGSMHIADPGRFYYGADGVMGASAAIANGAALKIRQRGEKDRVAVVFFGDGSSNEGAVFEAFNLAAVWKLPTLFVCVNNQYGMSTHISRVMADTDISKRALPFGMPSRTVDGNDVLAVYEAAKEARAYVCGHGPMLLVENTYRLCGHSKSDANVYRGAEEIARWAEKCPIRAFRARLVENGHCTNADLDEAERRADARVQRAAAFAQNSPEPSMRTLMDSVYA